MISSSSGSLTLLWELSSQCVCTQLRPIDSSTHWPTAQHWPERIHRKVPLRFTGPRFQWRECSERCKKLHARSTRRPVNPNGLVDLPHAFRTLLSPCLGPMYGPAFPGILKLEIILALPAAWTNALRWAVPLAGPGWWCNQRRHLADSHHETSHVVVVFPFPCETGLLS